MAIAGRIHWTPATATQAQSALVSLIVHMIAIIVLGLMILKQPVISSMQLEIANIVELPPQKIDLLPSQAVLVEVDQPLVAMSMSSMPSAPLEFSSVALAPAAVANPRDSGLLAWGNNPFGDKLFEGTGLGIGESLGGDFGERLGKAGAKTGDVQMSLVWDNFNDLDLHVVCPSAERISYQHKESMCRGKLDVDKNAGYGETKEPVENIYWPRGRALRGVYKVIVHYYARHDSQQDATPFQVAVKIDGEIKTFYGTVSSEKREVVIGAFRRK